MLQENTKSEISVESVPKMHIYISIIIMTHPFIFTEHFDTELSLSGVLKGEVAV